MVETKRKKMFEMKRNKNRITQHFIEKRTNKKQERYHTHI